MPKREYETWSRESEAALGYLPHETDEDRQRLVSAIRYHLDQSDQRKWPRALAWYENYHFLRGNHFPHTNFQPLAQATNASSFTDEEPVFHDQHPADQHIPRIVDNRLVKPYEKNISLLTRDRPIPRAESSSDDAFDEMASRAAEKVFSACWEYAGMHGKAIDAAAELCVTGLCVAETYFGPVGPAMSMPGTKEAEDLSEITAARLAERGRAAMRGDRERDEDDWLAEDLAVRLWSAFHLDPNPGATADPDTHLWFSRSTFEDLDELRVMFDRDEEGYYPDNLESMRETQGLEKSLYWYSRMKDVLDTPSTAYGGFGGYSASLYGTSGGDAPNQTLLHVIDTRPTRAYPEGRTLMLAGDALVYCGPNRSWHERYPWRWHPHSFARYWRMPGSFWGLPLLSVLVPLQKRLNVIDALMRLHREHMTIGQWLIPRTARIPEGTISGIPGQNYYYYVGPRGEKPELVRPQGFPRELLEERIMLQRNIDHLGEETPLGDQGPSPSGMRATSLIEFLDNKALRGRMPLLLSWQNFVESIGQNMLIEASTNLDDPDSRLGRRLQTALRRESMLSMEVFTGANLLDNVHLKIDLVSEMLKSPEAKREAAMAMLQYKHENLTPVENAVVYRALGLDELDKQVTPAYTRVQTMVSLILSGRLEAAQILPVDDPAIVVEVIRDTLLDPGVMDRPPEVQQVLYQLWMQASQLVQQQQQTAFLGQLRQQYLLARAENAEKPQLDVLEGGRGEGGRGRGGREDRSAAGRGGGGGGSR